MDLTMSFEEDFPIIKQITETQGCSGNEHKIRNYIRSLVEPYCDLIETDMLGNLICILKGAGGINGEKLKILLDAHMDEIGFIVRYIDKNGFIRFEQIGGQNIRILPGQTVTVHSTSGEDIIGIIGEKAIHLIEKEARNKISKFDELFIDVGMDSKEEVNEFISVGDYITLKQECTAFHTQKRIFSKAFDDRCGCFVLVKLIQELSQKKEELENDFIFLFAAQEEIGVRGATVGSYKVNPDIGIAVEVSHAIDFPGVNKDKFYECELGGGVTINVGPNFLTKLSKLLIETAKEQEIPFFLKAINRASPTDARAIHLTKEGVPCSLVGVPLRYMHTNVETIEYRDILHAVNLLKHFLLKDLRKAIKME